MNDVTRAALVGASVGALTILPVTALGMRIARKASNVLLLAPPDEERMKEYAARFGAPIGSVGAQSSPSSSQDDHHHGQYL